MNGPKQPSADSTAKAQTQSNQSTAISQQLLNMINQVGPDGSSTYAKSGTTSYFDPTLKKNIEIPQFTQTTKFNPTSQALYDQQNLFDKKTNSIAINQADRIGGVLSDPFHYNTGDHEKWAGDLYGKLTGDDNYKQLDQLRTTLSTQGLQPGSQAYDDAMKNAYYGQDKARNDFMLNSYGQGMNTALTERNQPINETTALMSAGQVQQPTFQGTPTVGVNGTDIAGIRSAAAANATNNNNSFLGGLFGMGSAALGGWAKSGFAFSDERLKEDIEQVGETPIDGVNVYEFKYKGSPLMQLGAMAQEVEKKVPSAVATHPSGYKMVNYKKLVQAMAA